MGHQIDLIVDPEARSYLPSAKMRPQDRVGVHGWTNFYAAYSERFATAAIKSLGVPGDGLVLDPFCGSGTTLVAALKVGIPAIGVDLDPFACTLARAKVAVNANGRVVARYLKPVKRNQKMPRFYEEAYQVFSERNLCYAGGVIDRISDRVGSSGEELIGLLLDDAEGVYDSECAALASVCISALSCASVVRGSNPTWNRIPGPGEAVEGKDLSVASVALSQKILSDLSHEYSQLSKGFGRNIRIFNADAQSLGKILKSKSASNFVFSPPYLTRIDYAVKNLPGILLLSALSGVSFDALRSSMMGTPKIVHKGDIDPSWGRVCLGTLEKIRNHPGYASERYYYWIYFQYFRAAFQALRSLSSRVSKKSSGLIVIQDSLYRDVEVDLASIYMEMLQGFSFSAKLVREEEVSMNMRNIRSRSRNASVNKRAREHVIFAQR